MASCTTDHITQDTRTKVIVVDSLNQRITSISSQLKNLEKTMVKREEDLAFAKEIFQHVSSTPVVKVLQEAIMGEEYD